MRGPASRLATMVVLVAVLTVGLAAPAMGQPAATASAMHITLEPDGQARWTVSVHYSLADANDTAAFDRLADEYVLGDTDVLSADPYRSAANLASEATGREMTLSNVTRAASVGNDTGELRLSFTWSNFARVEDGGERLVLGDVFTAPTGTWLPGVRDDQLLVIEFPADYAVQSSSRALDNGTIRVVGPVSFEPGHPSATLERTGPVATSPGSPPGPWFGIGVPAALSGLAALALLLGVGYLVYRRQQVEDGEPDEEDFAPADDPVDPELLSDEERVLRLLRAEGGRMKQVDIVEETDWSNAKVSQLLSSMAEAGRIDKLRIGRENLISLPDDEDE